MKQKLEENKGIPASLLWILAIISGLSVANLYYNQPLLNRISEDLGISEFTANLIPMTTQIGYALGLLFIIPLGDLYKRKNIIVMLSVATCSIAMSVNVFYILLASLVTGICSVMPQIFIPIAAQFSLPQNKARNVGMMVSGLLTGILGSRVISGFVGEYWGLRTMYYIAAVIMLLCIFVVVRVLPDMPLNFKGTYKGLMKSLFTLYRDNSTIRLVSARAGLCFGSFLGLCGVAGALTASFVGSLVHKFGVRFFTFVGCSLIIAAWIIMFIFQNSYLGFIVGIIVIDIGMQCVQIGNQTCALSQAPKATNRVNTIFMTTYFVGGSLGTFLAGTFWHAWGWTGVVCVGIGLTLISLLVTLFTRN